MATQDLTSELKVVNAFSPQSIASNTTTNGNDVDTQGYESVNFSILTGAITDGDYAVLIEEADDDGAGSPDTYSAVADDDLIGTEAVAGFTDDTDDDKASKIGYIGTKQWVRLSIVSTNVTTGGTLGASCELGHAHVSPGPQTTES